MKVKNKKNKTNYINFKAGGAPKKVMIPAGKTADISALINISQIINFGDFQRGFFEIVDEETKNIAAIPVKASKKKASKKKVSKKKTSNKKTTQDTLDKVEKEVKEYTDNDNKNKN